MARHNAPPRPSEATWPELAAMFSSVTRTNAPKAELPAWVPARLKIIGERTAKNTIEVTALVLDVDEATTGQWSGIRANLTAAGIEYVYHSTYSYDPTLPETFDVKKNRMVAGLCYRVIVQLSKPVPAERWKPFRATCVDAFGAHGAADPKTQDPCRLYYIPACPADGPEPDAGHVRGHPLDVDLILAHVPVTGAVAKPGAPPRPAQTATTADLERALPKRIDHITNEFARRGCQTLRNLLDGEDYAAAGERNEALFALAALLAYKFPHHTVESLIAPLAAPIDFTAGAAGSNNTSETLREMLTRAQAQVQAELQGEDPIRMRQLSRTGPYTPDEIAAFVTAHGLQSAEELVAQLIIDHRGDLYVFYNGDYIFAGSKETADSYLRHRLRAAQTLPGVLLRETNAKGGTVDKPIKRLLADYGVSVRNVVPSFDLQRSRVDHATETLFHAICPRRPHLRPAHDPEVETWLRQLGGEQHDTLLDWLATAPKLERPTAALYLHGGKHTGKSLLAAGLATIWGEAPTELQSLGVNFNGDLTGNPIVVADETLPLEYKQDTGLIRRLITAHSTKLRRKYMQDTNLRGAVRVVIAKNNLDLFSNSEETLTQDDIDAICERLLYVHTGHKPVHGISPERIACHILWLEQTREVEPTDRLWVKGQDSPLHRNMRVSSRSRSVVCQWLMGILDNAALVGDHRHMFRMDETGLHINPRLIYQRFEAYCAKERQPLLRDVCKVVSEIGTKKGKGLYTIHLADLAQYGQSHGYESSEQELAEQCAAGGAQLRRVSN